MVKNILYGMYNRANSAKYIWVCVCLMFICLRMDLNAFLSPLIVGVCLGISMYCVTGDFISSPWKSGIGVSCMYIFNCIYYYTIIKLVLNKINIYIDITVEKKIQEIDYSCGRGWWDTHIKCDIKTF